MMIVKTPGTWKKGQQRLDKRQEKEKWSNGFWFVPNFSKIYQGA
jgi:hypothetical protein